MDKIFEQDTTAEAHADKALDEPLPQIGIPEVTPSNDPRADAPLALSYFRLDCFARLVIHRLTLSGNHPRAWITATITDEHGATVREAKILHTEFRRRTPDDETRQTTIDSQGLQPGRYTVGFRADYGAAALLGGYAIFASAAQLSTEWGTAWGQVYTPQRLGEALAERSFTVLLT